eukprot:GFUD01016942.1.p1 GENE.GFUD01016942.1~~GFUD01016942.1.p1  ORF type:complete len:120 (-),score=19.49 GFUD01016942.1:112-471(-)
MAILKHLLLVMVIFSFTDLSLSVNVGWWNKCKLEAKVKLVLKTMNENTVAAVVDCIVGLGECDPTGEEIKIHAKDAVCSGRCGRHCTCDQIQYRLVVRKMKKEYSDQWFRLENKFKYTC